MKDSDNSDVLKGNNCLKKRTITIPRIWLVVICLFALVFAMASTVLFIHGEKVKKDLKQYAEQSKTDKYLYVVRSWNRCITDMEIDADIVFFGDSITSKGNFNVLFPNHRVVNMGVSGDSLQDMISRLEMIASVKPEKVFVLGGINSLREDNFSESIHEYTVMMDVIDQVTDAEVYIQGI